MEAESNRWVERGEACGDVPDFIELQRDHVADLIEGSNRGRAVLGIGDIFQTWIRQRRETITTYRDEVHTSVYTGTKSCKPKRPWMEAMDLSY